MEAARISGTGGEPVRECSNGHCAPAGRQHRPLPRRRHRGHGADPGGMRASCTDRGTAPLSDRALLATARRTGRPVRRRNARPRPGSHDRGGARTAGGSLHFRYADAPRDVGTAARPDSQPYPCLPRRRPPHRRPTCPARRHRSRSRDALDPGARRDRSDARRPRALRPQCRRDPHSCPAPQIPTALSPATAIGFEAIRLAVVSHDFGSTSWSIDDPSAMVAEQSAQTSAVSARRVRSRARANSRVPSGAGEDVQSY
ncbi:hypothetical protein SAMN05421854_11026 [Amycolatopsis rubida]|uniref:Uncharacterized protein n=1 Tax=Amycolatopsis rubida TaxID=112413 RepID=A0A1I5X4B0_9PSEU|nr:hypothetical protein SAMN05421854_11026 [Amycolatopsis rubida]